MIIILIIAAVVGFLLYKNRTLVFIYILLFLESFSSDAKDSEKNVTGGSFGSDGENSIRSRQDGESAQSYIKRMSEYFCDITQTSFAISDKAVSADDLFRLVSNGNMLKLYGMTNKVIVIEDIVSSVNVVDTPIFLHNNTSKCPCIGFGDLQYQIYINTGSGNKYLKQIHCYVEDFE